MPATSQHGIPMRARCHTFIGLRATRAGDDRQPLGEVAACDFFKLRLLTCRRLASYASSRVVRPPEYLGAAAAVTQPPDRDLLRSPFLAWGVHGRSASVTSLI